MLRVLALLLAIYFGGDPDIGTAPPPEGPPPK